MIPFHPHENLIEAPIVEETQEFDDSHFTYAPTVARSRKSSRIRTAIPSRHPDWLTGDIASSGVLESYRSDARLSEHEENLVSRPPVVIVNQETGATTVMDSSRAPDEDFSDISVTVESFNTALGNYVRSGV